MRGVGDPQELCRGKRNGHRGRGGNRCADETYVGAPRRAAIPDGGGPAVSFRDRRSEHEGDFVQWHYYQSSHLIRCW